MTGPAHAGDNDAPNETPAPPIPPDVLLPGRTALLARGWRQGAVLPPGQHGEIQWLGPEEAFANVTEADWLIIVTQDCDLVHDCFTTEPVCEVVVGTVVPKLYRSLTNLQNPRKLHFTAKDGAEAVTIEVQATRRGFITRKALLELHPSAERRLPDAAIRALGRLIARRYVRAARPEALDRRIGSKAREAFEGILRGFSNAIDDIYLRLPLDQRDELPAHQAYECDIVVLLHDTYVEETDAKAQAETGKAIKKAVRQALKQVDQDGIRTGLPMVVTREDLTLRDADELIPLDYGWPQYVADERRLEVAAAEEAGLKAERARAVASSTSCGAEE